MDTDRDNTDGGGGRDARTRRRRFPPRVLPLSEWRLVTRFAVSFALVAAFVIVLIGSLAYNTAAYMIRSDAQAEFQATVDSLTQDLRSPSLGPRPATGPRSTSCTPTPSPSRWSGRAGRSRFR